MPDEIVIIIILTVLGAAWLIFVASAIILGTIEAIMTDEFNDAEDK